MYRPSRARRLSGEPYKVYKRNDTGNIMEDAETIEVTRQCRCVGVIGDASSVISAIAHSLELLKLTADDAAAGRRLYPIQRNQGSQTR